MTNDVPIVMRSKLGVDGIAKTVRVRVGQRHRLILERPRTQILQMEDVCFGTDRSVLLPAVRLPNEQPASASDAAHAQARREGLSVIAATLAFSQLHPQRQLLVAGHTDSVGDAAYNLELSRRRANNVLMYLRGDRDGWAADSAEHYSRADFKRVHLWAAQMLGWSTDPGPLDESWNAATKAARDEFRRRCEDELGVTLESGVKQNAGDWAAIFDLYDQHLARLLRVPFEDLGRFRGALTMTDPATLGCGEHWPVEAIGIDDLASGENRRVDVLFFDPEEVPADLQAEPPGVGIYGSGLYRPEYIPVGALGGGAAAAEFELMLELRDHWIATPVASAPYEIRGPLPGSYYLRTGITDPQGRLRETELPAGAYLVLSGDSFTVAGSRLTHVLKSLQADVHRLRGLGADRPAVLGPAYANAWVVPTPAQGDFVEHRLDNDFDVERE